MADNPSDNQKSYQPPQLQPDIMSSTAEAASKAFEKRKKGKEEETSERESVRSGGDLNTSEEEQQNISVKMQQNYARRQKEYKEKTKSLEEEIKTLKKTLLVLNLVKIFSKFLDMGNYIAKSIVATLPYWITIVIFIIEFLAIIPGIIIFVFVGLLKGPATKKIDKQIKQIKKDLEAKENQMAEERKKLEQAET